ncbi:CapA family protein [Nostocoides australiense]|nr:CapA family protein [Tetrasphaera sp.]HPF81583.1 CapA family protein [Tetrasphaera australiensis]HRW02976.1 CapA family protein [Tetrasphaera sp.]
MTRRRSPLAAALAVAVLAGCSATAGTGRTSAGASPAGANSVAPPAKDVVLAFGGDIHFESYLAKLARDPAGLAALQKLWADADFRMANLETAITEGGTRVVKAFNFRAPASALTTLAGAGMSAMSLANNHGVDYGLDGLADTLAARANSPFPIVGIGADEADAFAPKIVDVSGLKVALLGASQVNEETLAQFSAGPGKPGIASSMPPTRLVDAVARVRAQADVVVVFMHWGMDYTDCPDQRSIDTSNALASAGADIVVGGHSHRINGAGWLGKSYIAYGLGNFVWWRATEPDSRTGILRLTVDPALAKQPAAQRKTTVVVDATWQPLLIGRDGIPATPPPADHDRLMDVWVAAGRCSGLTPTP